jgi:hypothetical protein
MKERRLFIKIGTEGQKPMIDMVKDFKGENIADIYIQLAINLKTIGENLQKEFEML